LLILVKKNHGHAWWAVKNATHMAHAIELAWPTLQSCVASIIIKHGTTQKMPRVCEVISGLYCTAAGQKALLRLCYRFWQLNLSFWQLTSSRWQTNLSCWQMNSCPVGYLIRHFGFWIHHFGFWIHHFGTKMSITRLIAGVNKKKNVAAVSLSSLSKTIANNTSEGNNSSTTASSAAFTTVLRH